VSSNLLYNSILPPRPLRLRPSFVWKYLLGGLALISLGVAIAIGSGWWQLDCAKELLDESRIWSEGIAAQQATMSGDVTTHKFIFHEYKLQISYVDATGMMHRANLKFDTLIGQIDDSQGPVVHYLKDSPDRFALSSAIDVSISRWASILFLAVTVVGLIGGSCILLGLRALWRLRDARRCATHSEEVIATITHFEAKVANGKHTRNIYHFSGKTADGRALKGKADFSSKESPLYAAKQTILVLAPQDNPDRAVAVRSDFHPFVLNAEEAKRARAELSRRCQENSPNT
jgi:hypothetical protein